MLSHYLFIIFSLKISLIMVYCRKQLRHMLQTSNLYRVQLILGKVKETDMHAESAILYGKVS